MLVLRKGGGRGAAARRICCLACASGASGSRPGLADFITPRSVYGCGIPRSAIVFVLRERRPPTEAKRPARASRGLRLFYAAQTAVMISIAQQSGETRAMPQAMSWEEWAKHDAIALATGIRAGERRHREAAAQAAAAIARLDAKLEAVLGLYDDVLADPDPDRPDAGGRLYGVPMLLKDPGSGLA